MISKSKSIDISILKKLFSLKKYNECEVLVRKLLELHSNNEILFNILGAVLGAQKKYVESKKAFNQAIVIKPNYYDAYYKLGIILQELSELPEAINCYKKVIEIQPSHTNAHNDLGVVFKRLREFQKAKSCYEKAIQHNPNHVGAHINLGNVQKELGDYKEAEICYEKAIEIDPNQADAHNNLGIIIAELSKGSVGLHKAINCYEKAIEIQPNHADAHNNLGGTLNQLGERQKAINCYEKTIEIQPKHPKANDNLGVVYKELGEHEKAIVCFKKANSISSRAELLKYSYLLKGLDDYKKNLEKFVKEEPCSIRVAAMSAYVSKKKNIKNIYPFCKEPLNFVFTNNLKNELTSTSKFSENLLKILGKVPTIWEPASRTTKGGFQTIGNLFDNTDSEILQLQKMIKRQIISYREIYKDSQDYFITKWPSEAKLRAWYVKLFKQGHQTAHIHPSGWLSGVFYVKVPKALHKNEGSIKLSLSGYDYSDDENLPSLIHSPKDLDIILFPSSLFHQTVPFNLKDERHAIAFDLIKIS